MAGVLSLRDESSGQAWRVWPDPEVPPPGAVREMGRYLFELEQVNEAQAAELLVDGVPLEALRSKSPTEARWRWEPGFHAGTVEAEIRVPGAMRRRFEVTTDPDLKKLTREHFDVMVREILEDSFALFSLSAFRKSVAHGAGARPPAIARLEFLRTRVEELERVVAAILRSPRRRLAAEEIALPYHRASPASGPEIIRSFRSGPVLREAPPGGRLPPPLRGCLPALIKIRRKLNTTDIAEHRQMGSCLRVWAAWLAAAAEQLSRSRGVEVELRQDIAIWASRCRQLSRRMQAMASNEPFFHGEPAQPGLTLSAVFRSDPKYRSFYRIWQDMNRGIAAVFGDFLDLPLARTWELYELWCFVRLLRAAVVEFGAQDFDPAVIFRQDAAGGLTVSAGAVVVPVGGGWKLCFQKRYSEFWAEGADGRGSFSRTMTPDIVAAREAVEAVGKELLIVLDAKYRIDEGLNDAISSVHTYRDALVRDIGSGKVEGIVSAAYLLTPQLNVTGPGDYRHASMPGRLFRPDYRAAFRFGAVTLRPGMSLADLGAVLQGLIADATG